jgi:membrane-associated phospholipid phosphatase
MAKVGPVGQSRIYEGNHWPTDVAASHLLCTAYVIGLTALYRWVKARERGR